MEERTWNLKFKNLSLSSTLLITKLPSVVGEEEFCVELPVNNKQLRK